MFVNWDLEGMVRSFTAGRADLPRITRPHAPSVTFLFRLLPAGHSAPRPRLRVIGKTYRERLLRIVDLQNAPGQERSLANQMGSLADSEPYCCFRDGIENPRFVRMAAGESTQNVYRGAMRVCLGESLGRSYVSGWCGLQVVSESLCVAGRNDKGICARINGSRYNHCVAGGWIPDSQPEVWSGAWPAELYNLAWLSGIGVYGNEWVIADRHLVEGCCVLLWNIDDHGYLNAGTTRLGRNAIALASMGDNPIAGCRVESNVLTGIVNLAFLHPPCDAHASSPWRSSLRPCPLQCRSATRCSCPPTPTVPKHSPLYDGLSTGKRPESVRH